MEWIIIVGFVVAMYIVIYKYEKKMEKLEEMIKENKNNIDKNVEKISKNRKHINENYEKTCTNDTRLNKHHSHIERMWVTIPEIKGKEE